MVWKHWVLSVHRAHPLAEFALYPPVPTSTTVTAHTLLLPVPPCPWPTGRTTLPPLARSLLSGSKRAFTSENTCGQSWVVTMSFDIYSCRETTKLHQYDTIEQQVHTNDEKHPQQNATAS